MKSYTFYTISTVVDIGDGHTKPIENEKMTSTVNLNRLLEQIMVHSYPMMVSVSETLVDLKKYTNSSYYNLPAKWGECIVRTFKFALEHDVDIKIDGIPLVLPTIVNGIRINKFVSTGTERNISISKKTFS